MYNYLVVEGQIDSIENENAPDEYNPKEWTKLDRIVCGTIRMHLLESVYYTMQLCLIAYNLWKTLLDTYERCCGKLSLLMGEE